MFFDFGDGFLNWNNWENSSENGDDQQLFKQQKAPENWGPSLNIKHK